MVEYIIVKNDTEKRQQFMSHATQSPLLRKWASVRERWMSLPVCPRCHRIALRDRQPSDPPPPAPVWITCPRCHYHGPNTMPVAAFIKAHVIDSSTADVKRRDSWRDMLKIARRA